MLSSLFLVSIFAISNANSDSSLCIDACEYLRGKHCEQLCADNSGTTEIIKTAGTIRTTARTETTTASPTTRNRDKDYRGCVTVCTSYGELDCENKCKKLIYGYDSTAVPTPNETTNKDKDYSKCVTVCTIYGELDCEKKCKKLIYGYTSTAAPTPKETTTTESITTHKPITEETATTRTTESVTTNVMVPEETTTTISAYRQCLKNCSIFFFKNWCEDLCSL